MKKFLKIFGVLLGLILILVLIGATTIHFSGIPKYEVNAPALTVIPDSTMIAEGRRLATMVCYNCHLNNQKLEGAQMMDENSEFGSVWAANITQHPEAGIGKYTDGELAYLLRTGIRKDGQYAPPYMPKFPLLSDQDLHSIIAYLRSDAPEVQPSPVKQPQGNPSFLTKLLCRVAFKPLPFPEQEIVAPPLSDQVAYGKYLATAKVECFSCHSADFTTLNDLEPEKSAGFMGGGNPVEKDETGHPIYSANLTMSKTTGIGNWSEADFIKALKYGQRPDGRRLRSPMIPYAALTDEEAAAIWAYLQTIPEIENEVER